MQPVDYKTLITVEQLSSILDQKDLVILDCSFSLADTSLGRKLYLSSHIPGAYFMDINLDLSSPVIKGVTGRHPLPHPLVLASSLRAAGLHSNSQVIVYDQSNGMYASRAWWLLNWLGHEKVALLDGGFAAWTASKQPVDNQWPPPKQGSFEFTNPNLATVGMKELVSESHILIDSREHMRFIGEIEKIDPVAGHIPGAICIPYADNTDQHGFWKSADQLREKFETLSQDVSGPPVFYCGSGVTACHNILAYKIATGKNASLYPGSYSEWINYYPVETGA
jgi:thiosulfate/3-mercaptopyruvate sulfurtransferase